MTIHNNSELIKAGRDFRDLMTSGTALMDIAKMISNLASQLDLTTAALREKTKQCDELAVENGTIKTMNDCLSEELRSYESDAAIAGIRNEAGSLAVELFAQNIGSPYSEKGDKCYEDGFTRAIEIVRDINEPRFAAKLRKEAV